MHILHKIALLSLGVTLLAGVSGPARAQGPDNPEQIISINSGWEFRQRTNDDKVPAVWRPAEVPGMVHTDLLKNSLIPDPYDRDNESKLQWIENADWEYLRHLEVSRELLNRGHLDLVFEGLDTCADVYLNGSLILTADNMFLEWRVDIKSHVRQGANDLLVVFHSPIKAAAPAWYHPGRSGTLALGPKVLAVFGELHPKIVAAFDLTGPVAAFEVILDAIPESKAKKTSYAPSPYQAVERDFAFVVNASVSADEIVKAAKTAERALIETVAIFDVYEGKGIPDGKKSLAITVRLQPKDKTLTDTEIEAVGQRIVAAVAKATGGTLRA